MRSLGTVCFVSASDHEHRVMRSLFSIAGHREKSDWLLKDPVNQHDADVVVVDAEIPEFDLQQIKSQLHAKIMVAYSVKSVPEKGFDAHLRKPVRSRDLVALLDHLERLLFT